MTPLRISTQLSYTAVRLLPARKDDFGNVTTEGQATACFFLLDNKLILLTNWHVVTCWDPLRDQALSATGFRPNLLRFTLLLKPPVASTLPEGTMYARREFDVDLYQDGSARWLEHPRFGRRVDVVAIHVANTEEELLGTLPLNAVADWVDFELSAGDDAFVLGYPRGISSGSLFPVWKRASIATEPDMNLDGLPKLLIDTATREGMSGAPVIANRSGLTVPRGKQMQDSFFGECRQFLGIYSGRLGADDMLAAQLGIVWKAAAVQEIATSGVIGSAPN